MRNVDGGVCFPYPRTLVRMRVLYLGVAYLGQAHSYWRKQEKGVSMRSSTESPFA